MLEQLKATESNWKQKQSNKYNFSQIPEYLVLISSLLFLLLPRLSTAVGSPRSTLEGETALLSLNFFPPPPPLHHLHYPPLHHHHSVQQEHKCPQPCFLNSNPFLNGTHTIKNSAHWMQYITQSNRIGFKFFTRKKLNAMFVHSHSTQPKNVQM